MDNTGKSRKPCAYGDAFGNLKPNEQKAILKRLERVAKACIEASPMLRSAEIDPRERAGDIVHDAFKYQIGRGEVQVWTPTDLWRVTAWKVRLLVEDERKAAWERMQQVLPVERLIRERHYDDSAAHEDHGPSFKGRVQRAEAEHVGREFEEPSELADLLKAIETFFERMGIPAERIADILAYVEDRWHHQVKLTPKGKLVRQEKEALLKDFGWTIDRLASVQKLIMEHRQALSAWLAARGYTELVRRTSS